jgi:hypothetical protein
MEIRPIYIILADISGYTRFIKKHRISLLHAEKIIGELMESILDKVESPVIAHEILGDAVSFYAEDNGDPALADNIYSQVLGYFETFKEKEASLISNCDFCKCDACQDIGKLTLKAILHVGEVAFTKVRDIRKISGEDVILSHRLLKNSVPSKEYILLTSDFAQRCTSVNLSELEIRNEHCEGIGSVQVRVKNFEEHTITPVQLTPTRKLRNVIGMVSYTWYMLLIGKILGKSQPEFQNLPYE